MRKGFFGSEQYTIILLTDLVHQTADKHGRVSMQKVLFIAFGNILKDLNNATDRCFEISTFERS